LTPTTSPQQARADDALAALYDPAAQRPIVAYVFLGLCLVFTIPALVHPALYDVFGGIEPRRHWWQPFTAALMHGWPGFHGSVHLALNVFLILECGRPCERLLGHGRFLALGLLSLAANALVLTFTEGVNGSSLVIWSWGPPLFVALMWAKRHGAGAISTGYQRVRGILILMYGIIVLVMAFLPYIFGWRGNPVTALFRANLFHLVATGVGIVFAWYFGGYIRNRLSGLGGVLADDHVPG
jgi:membrane associated rhomboid family serine protease